MALYNMKCCDCGYEATVKFGMTEKHECECSECGGEMTQIIVLPRIFVRPSYNEPQELTRENWHDNIKPR